MYYLIGDSGTVIFQTTGTVTSEAAKLSSKVTSNPIEGGGNITDHAVLDPVSFSISGVVSSAAEYATLEAMWKNRDLLKYRGKEAYDNLLITALQRTHSTDNEKGYSFQVTFQQITITSPAYVNTQDPTMSQQDATTTKAEGTASAEKTATATAQTTQSGLITTSSTYASYVASFNSTNTNTSVGTGRTNPSYAGYSKAVS